MRIGICLRTWGERGGIGVYTRSIVNAMVDFDRKNQYVLFFSDPLHLGTFESADHVQEICVKASGKWMWDQWAVPQHAKRENVDIVFHTKFSIPFLAKCKTAMVCHGTERFVYPEFHRMLDIWFHRIVYVQYLKRASLIVAVSNLAREDLIRRVGIDAEKIRTVPLAVNQVFRIIREERLLEEIREKYALPKMFILYVGHIYPGKNIGRLLKSMAIVRKEMDVDIVIAGAPRWKYKSELDLISQLDLSEHVHILGHVSQEELAVLYNLAAATAFPSFYESFGLPNLEANACACPLVTSQTGGSPEVAGDAALYIDPLDVDGMAAAITRVLSDATLREDLIQKGLMNVKRFSWEKAARETLGALEWVVTR